MRKEYFKIWKGIDYVEEIEPFLESIPCGFPTDKDDIECFYTLLQQTKKDIKNQTVPNNQNFSRLHTENDGKEYLIVKNGFHKFSMIGKTLVNTVTDTDELLEVPFDPNMSWLVDFVAKDI